MTETHYVSPDAVVPMIVDDGLGWLSQNSIQQILGLAQPTVSEHLKNIEIEGVFPVNSFHRNYRWKLDDGREREVKHYNSEVVTLLASRSQNVSRAMSFLRWVASTIAELKVKGFVLDEQRLDADELAREAFFAKVREIRTSDREAYRKITDEPLSLECD